MSGTSSTCRASSLWRYSQANFRAASQHRSVLSAICRARQPGLAECLLARPHSGSLYTLHPSMLESHLALTSVSILSKLRSTFGAQQESADAVQMARATRSESLPEAATTLLVKPVIEANSSPTSRHFASVFLPGSVTLVPVHQAPSP